MKRIKVKYGKLGKSKAWGWSHGNGVIELDEKLKGLKFIEILVHECLHELFPELIEEEVERKAAIIARTLWHEDVRRVESHKSKLQDEK